LGLVGAQGVLVRIPGLEVREVVPEREGVAAVIIVAVAVAVAVIEPFARHRRQEIGLS